MRKDLLKKVRRVVVKVGSSLVTQNDLISTRRISALVKDISFVVNDLKVEVVLVSSGAIASGLGSLNKKRQNFTIPEKQALASVGQVVLVNEYKKHFARQGLNIGQILLTEDDLKNRRRFLNARHSLNALLKLGAVPIINENDSVVVKEIKFGDNDTLSAHVAGLVEADLLILLSDVAGFYDNPLAPKPSFLKEITKIDDQIRSKAGSPKNSCGTGGMMTKIKAAEIMMKFGEKMIIADGRQKEVLSKILKGEEIGTIFYNQRKPLSSRKKWITLKKTKGIIFVDQGAVNALAISKKSLLAIGIVKVEGQFQMGDPVSLADNKGNFIGQGIVNYNSDELVQIMGKKNIEIKRILGYNYFSEVINRDDLIIF